MRQSHCVFAMAERHEPYEPRGSRTVLRAPGGEIPPGDSTKLPLIGSFDSRPLSGGKQNQIPIIADSRAPTSAAGGKFP